MGDWKNIVKGVAKEVAKANLESWESTAKRQAKNKNLTEEQRDQFARFADGIGEVRDVVNYYENKE